MTLIKYRIGKARIGIITDLYRHDLEFILEMSNILKADYPELKDDNIDVLEIAGELHAKKLAFETTVINPKNEYEPYPAKWLVTP